MPDRVTFTERRMKELHAGASTQKDLLVYDAEVRELAARIREGGSPRWYLQKWSGGKQHRVVLGTWPAVPVEVARELAREALVKLARGVDPLEAKRAAVAKAAGGTVPILKVLERHVAKLAERKRSDRHVEEIENVIKRAHDAGIKDLADPSCATKAEKWLSGLEISALTRNRYRAHLIAMGKTAQRWWSHDVLPRDPFMPLQGTGAPLPVPPYFTPVEAVRLVSDDALALVDVKGPLWAFLLYTGCRFREGVYARWGRIDLEGASFVVLPPTTKEREAGEAVKRNKARTVGLQRELVELLKAWRKEDPTSEFVFPKDWRDQHHHWNVVQFRDWLARLEIPLAGRRIHSLRHTHAVLAIASGEDSLRSRLSMGHAGEQMQSHYASAAMRWRGLLNEWAGVWELRSPAGENVGLIV